MVQEALCAGCRHGRGRFAVERTTVASQAPATQQVAPWILQALDSPSRLDTVAERARALREIERSETPP